MIVVLTDAAMADLTHIGDYIANDNPERAIRFVRELLDRCRRLAEMPKAFPLVPRYEASGVRRYPYGHDLIFYRVGEDQVDILHILHGAQNYEAILFPQG